MSIKLCKDKYKLYLKWTEICPVSPGMFRFEDAEFYGPVMKEVAEVKPHDMMDLDFTKQNNSESPTHHIARLTWWGAKRIDNKVFFDKCVLATDQEEVIGSLDKASLILVDTSGHEEDEHIYNLVYQSYLVQ